MKILDQMIKTVHEKKPAGSGAKKTREKTWEATGNVGKDMHVCEEPAAWGASTGGKWPYPSLTPMQFGKKVSSWGRRMEGGRLPLPDVM